MMRRTWLLTVLLGLALLAFTLTTPFQRIVYNASDSAPRGWYAVSPVTALHRGDFVVATLPPAVADFADARHYLPRTVPVLKHIGALSGQHVCIRQRIVRIDGQVLGRALAQDGAHRPLTVWSECRRLSADEIFLFAPVPDGAYDSRYFGPVSRGAVRGIARPLWTWTTP